VGSIYPRGPGPCAVTSLNSVCNRVVNVVAGPTLRVVGGMFAVIRTAIGILANHRALFVPFSSRIHTEALKWNNGTPTSGTSNDWYFYDSVYTGLGYQLVGKSLSGILCVGHTMRSIHAPQTESGSLSGILCVGHTMRSIHAPQTESGDA
jgi:hypothetical protein